MGNMYWYDWDEARNSFSFDIPSATIPTRMNGLFTDRDTGSWYISRSRHTNQSRTLQLSRQTFNPNGSVWQFPGVGGLGSRHMDSAAPAGSKYLQEAYFFHGDIGCMAALHYTCAPDAGLVGQSQLRLESVGVLPFVRCSETGVRLRSPPRRRSLQETTALARGWPGTHLSFGPGADLLGPPVPCGPFDPAPLLSSQVCGAVGRLAREGTPTRDHVHVDR